MSKKSGDRVRRSYSQEFRLNAVSLVEDQGYTVAQASRELGVHANLLRKWRQKYGRRSQDGMNESEQQELERLRRENGRLRMERDILKKATAFFANEKN